MATFRGRRQPDGCQVTLEGEPLSLRLDLRNHSPAGFEWGYGGSGPAQLALAMCAAVLGDEAAFECYQFFKAQVVAGFAREWTYSSDELRRWFVRWKGEGHGVANAMGFEIELIPIEPPAQWEPPVGNVHLTVTGDELETIREALFVLDHPKSRALLETLPLAVDKSPIPDPESPAP